MCQGSCVCVGGEYINVLAVGLIPEANALSFLKN